MFAKGKVIACVGHTLDKLGEKERKTHKCAVCPFPTLPQLWERKYNRSLQKHSPIELPICLPTLSNTRFHQLR